MYFVKILIIIVLLVSFGYITSNPSISKIRNTVNEKDILMQSIAVDKALSLYAKSNNGQYPNSFNADIIKNLGISQEIVDKFTYKGNGSSYELSYIINNVKKISPNSNKTYKTN